MSKETIKAASPRAIEQCVSTAAICGMPVNLAAEDVAVLAQMLREYDRSSQIFRRDEERSQRQIDALGEVSKALWRALDEIDALSIRLFWATCIGAGAVLALFWAAVIAAFFI